MKWLLVALVVAATCASDLAQAHEMRRARPRYAVLAAAVGCMAVSFFSFLKLLQLADLSFAVPATAFTIVIETALARVVLREQVAAKRWIGAALVACGVAVLARS